MRDIFDDLCTVLHGLNTSIFNNSFVLEILILIIFVLGHSHNYQYLYNIVCPLFHCLKL